MIDDLRRIELDSQTALLEWLSHHHRSDDSFLLVTWKKSNKEKYISREQILDALLAYGWIDGRRFALDESRTMQLICKRKQQNWTQSYRDRVARLQSEGLMKPSGLAVVNKAKKQGTWLVNEDVDLLICPDDLAEALHRQNGFAWWEGTAPSYRRNILRWLSTAKKAETRQKRCAEIATACASGQKIKY